MSGNITPALRTTETRLKDQLKGELHGVQFKISLLEECYRVLQGTTGYYRVLLILCCVMCSVSLEELCQDKVESISSSADSDNTKEAQLLHQNSDSDIQYTYLQYFFIYFCAFLLFYVCFLTLAIPVFISYVYVMYQNTKANSIWL